MTELIVGYPGPAGSHSAAAAALLLVLTYGVQIIRSGCRTQPGLLLAAVLLLFQSAALDWAARTDEPKPLIVTLPSTAV